MATILERLPIAEGSTVVDVGAGNSEELLSLSRMVGEDGMVVGIEHSAKIVKRIGTAMRGKRNIRIYVGEAERIPLPDDSAHVVLFKGVLHEVREVPNAFREAKRICKHGGRVIAIDFSSFPVSWLKRSNLQWLVRHPWKFLNPPLDLQPGFSENDIRSHIEETSLSVERYEDSFGQGSFSGHPIPMFLAVAAVLK